MGPSLLTRVGRRSPDGAFLDGPARRHVRLGAATAPGAVMDERRPFTRLDLTTGAGPSWAPSGHEAGLPVLPDPLPPVAPSGFHVLSKPTGAICNLDCTYCFFLSKEALYPGSPFRMTEATHEQYIRQLLESQQSEHVTVAWQGGEPTLMGLDFFRSTMALVERYRRPDQVIEHTIQTNGTRLDEAWAAFFAEHGVLVGLSLDGPAEIHDAQRVDKGGQGTHARVVRGARLLQAAGAEFNILCTVHALNGDRGREVYRYFRDDIGARFVQFIPIVERATPESLDVAEAGWGSHVEGRPLYTQTGSLVTSRSVGSRQYGDFLVDVFEEWVRRDVGSVYVQMFDVTLANFVGAPPGLCVHSETCGRALAMEHNGDLYSCDHFVEPRYKLGNINETHMIELVSSVQQLMFGMDKRDRLPQQCRECEVRFACHGGCPKDRFRDDMYGQPGLNYLCASYKRFFGHVGQPMLRMGELLGAGRAAAEIMYDYAAADAARGRNDDCSCGSGLKFKRCHGDRPLPTRAELDRAVARVMSQ
jgi:uncharacterized protein